jgi:acyl carrier protein
VKEMDLQPVINPSTLEDVKAVVVATLAVADRANSIDASTPLLGGLPEMDSLAVVELVVALQTRFGIAIDDDEVNADVFDTLGSLAALIDGKLSPG